MSPPRLALFPALTGPVASSVRCYARCRAHPQTAVRAHTSKRSWTANNLSTLVESELPRKLPSVVVGETFLGKCRDRPSR